MNSSNELDKAPLEAFMGMIPAGSYVVPSHDMSGNRRESGQLYGNPAQIQKLSQIVSNHASRTGATKTVSKVELPIPKPIKATKVPKTKKKGREEPPAIAQIVPNEPESRVFIPNHTEPTSRPVDVEFLMEFGNIAVTADTVLDSELAIALVFKNEKDMRFIPKTGTFLNVRIGGDEMKVYYPGIVLTWTDFIKKIMIFIKAHETES